MIASACAVEAHTPNAQTVMPIMNESRLRIGKCPSVVGSRSMRRACDFGSLAWLGSQSHCHGLKGGGLGLRCSQEAAVFSRDFGAFSDSGVSMSRRTTRYDNMVVCSRPYDV